MKRVVFFGLLLFTAGVFGLGSFFGYRYSEQRIRRTPEPFAVVIKDRKLAAKSIAPAEVTMPDVVGMSKVEALEAMADSGIDTGKVTLRETESPRTAGVVLAQSPTKLQKGPAKVTLTLSKPGRFPDLVGKSRAEALAVLQALGIRPQTTLSYDAERLPGTVKAMVPAAGSPLVGSVMLDLVDAPAAAYLTDAESIAYANCEKFDKGQMAGVAVTRALVCNAHEAMVDYLLDGTLDRFEATVGQFDDGSTTYTATFEVFSATGELLGSKTTKFGESAVLVVPIRGELRLRLRTTVSDPSNCCSGLRAAFVDPKVIGTSQATATFVEPR